MEILERDPILAVASTNGASPNKAVPVDWRGLSVLIAQIAAQSEEIGRLRAERDALAIERNRLIQWIESDRALTDRLFTVLEADLASLRAELDRVRAAEEGAEQPIDPSSLFDQPLPPRAFGIGRRRRSGSRPGHDERHGG